MADIFISYASEDLARAKTLAGVLEQRGWSVWWDRKILPGKTFDQVIAQALDATKCIIVLWSKESVNSDWVKEEASEGQRRGILVPALIDDVTIPLGFRRLQAARLTDWQPTSPHPEFDQFLEAIAAIVGRHRIAETKRAAELSSLHEETQRVQTSEQMYHEAQSAMAAEDWAGAIEKLQAVLALDRAHVEAAAKLSEAQRQQELAALYDSGRKHYEAGHWREALENFNQLLERDANYKDGSSFREHVQRKLSRERAAPAPRPQPAETALELKKKPKPQSPPSHGADLTGVENTTRRMSILTTCQLVCSILLLASGIEIFVRTREGILVAPGLISFVFIGFPASIVLGKLSRSVRFRLGILQGWLIPPVAFAVCLMLSLPEFKIGVLPYAALLFAALVLIETGVRTLKTVGTSRLLMGIAIALPGGYLAATGFSWITQGTEYLNSATLWEFYIWIIWPASSIAIWILFAGVTSLYPEALRLITEALRLTGLIGALGLVLGGGIVLHLSPQPMRTLEGHTSIVRSVAFSPDGTLLASGADDETVRLWRVSDSKHLYTLESHGDVNSVAFSPDGTLLASGAAEDTVQLWRVADGKLLRMLKGNLADDSYLNVYSVAFSPDGTLLASGSGDETVRLWRVSDGKLLRTLKGHVDIVKVVAFSPDGTMLASGSGDETVRLWRVADGKLLHRLEGHISGTVEGRWVWSVAFSPDGTLLASGGDDDTVQLWRVADGTRLHRLRVGEGVTSVAFSPDGTMLAAGLWREGMRLWLVANARDLDPLNNWWVQRFFGESVLSVAFSQDGTRLASGHDETVKLWKLKKG